MKIRFSELKEKASNRPEGYLDDVLASGTLEGDVLTISPAAYQALVEKYNPNALIPPVQSNSCCEKASPSPNKRLQMPPVGTQMANIGSSMVRTTANLLQGNKVKASDDIIKTREETCQGCEFLDKTRNRCSKCGCFYKVKITLATEKCPIDKWAAVQ